MKRNFIVLVMLCPLLTMCQMITIKGKLINEQMEAVEGATILLKRTGAYTTSNAKGEFELRDTRLFDTIVISAIGYETTEQPNNERGLITIILKKKSVTLEEVTINTGYEIIPKERATGSFTTVNNELLNQQVGSNIMQRLEGITNGVLFDKNPARPAVTVRGLSTIYGNKNPLIVLDNFPFEGDIQNINPNDIESITILKDAAAASIWGTRAGNGVIVITSKKAKLNQPLSIQFNSNIQVQQKPDLFYLNEMTASDFIEVEKFLFSKGFYASQENNNSKPALSPVVELLIAKRNGRLSASDADAAIKALQAYDVRNEFNEYMYQPSLNQQYGITMRGGMEKATMLFSAGFDRNKSELDAKYNRATLKFENLWKPLTRLQVNTSMVVAQSRNENGRQGWGEFTINGKKLYPYAQFATAQGDALPVYMNRQTFIDTAGGGKLLDWKLYPLTDYLHHTTKSVSNNYLGNLGINYSIINGLSIDVKLQYQQQHINTETLQDVQSFAARDLINRFSQINHTTGVVKYNVPLGGILNETNNITAAINGRSHLNYSRGWKNHSIAVLGGVEARQVVNSNDIFRIYGFNSNSLTTINVDAVNSYPNYITGSNQTIPTGNSFSEKTHRFTSLFANAAYTLFKKYSLSASARKDASNIFGVNANEKWVPLWSSGIAWELSKENFYKINFLPYLKLKATYGFNGNVDLSRSAVTTISFFPIPTPLTNYRIANISQFGNPNLSWERVKLINIGAEFNTKNNIINGSIEYYRKSGLDLFGQSPIDYTTGLGTTNLIKNVANMKGHGFDVELNSKTINRRIKVFQSLIVNYNRNKIVKYFLSNTQGSFYTTGGNVITPLPGQPVYSVISYKWAGLDASTGNPMGVVDGQATTNYTDITGIKTKINDLVYSGSATPVVFGNFRNTIGWGPLSLTLNINYKLGYYFRRQSIVYNSLFSFWQGHPDYSKRWQKPGDENVTHVPSMIYPNSTPRDGFYNSSEILVTKGDLIRLQYINVMYDVQNIRGSLPINRLRFYFNASDLGLIWKANNYGIDPDYPANIKPSKGFAFGISADF